MSEDIKDVQNEETQVMTFLDENGNKVQFEAVARIYLEEKEYLLLAPMEDKESEDIYVFRIDEVEGKQELNLVEDDKEFIAVKKALTEEEIQVEVLKKLKMDGLLLKNVELVKAMDKDMETYSLVIPAAFKKDGDFTSTSSVVTEEQFELLRKYVNDKMIEICEEMLSGEVKIEPCKSSKVTYCDYCDYSAICQFDTSIRDNKYKIILKKKKDDLWNSMINKVKEEEGE